MASTVSLSFLLTLFRFRNSPTLGLYIQFREWLWFTHCIFSVRSLLVSKWLSWCPNHFQLSISVWNSQLWIYIWKFIHHFKCFLWIKKKKILRLIQILYRQKNLRIDLAVYVNLFINRSVLYIVQHTSCFFIIYLIFLPVFLCHDSLSECLSWFSGLNFSVSFASCFCSLLLKY